MKSNADHVNKRNYDDFNEFFWSRECLRYRYTCEDRNKYDAEDPSRINAPLPGEAQPPITVGMLNAPKTFLEKRSWLRGIMALSRLVEWHIVTFYLLSVVAFSRGELSAGILPLFVFFCRRPVFAHVNMRPINRFSMGLGIHS